MHCALAQISEQIWSPQPGFLLIKTGLKRALQEGICTVPTTESCSVCGMKLELLWKSPHFFSGSACLSCKSAAVALQIYFSAGSPVTT